MLTGAGLDCALRAIEPVRFAATLYHAVHPAALYGLRHGVPSRSTIPLYALGASARGARSTPIGVRASLYLAADPLTAYSECTRVFAQAWGSTGNAPALPPTVTLSVAARPDAVLDLTQREARRRLSLTER